MLKIRAKKDSNRFVVTPGKTWSQGFATYGGYVAASALRAAAMAGHDRPLLSAQINFLAPAPSSKYEIEIEALRIGKGTSVIEARVWADKDGDPLLTSKFLFTMGLPRPSQLDVRHRLQEEELKELDRRRERIADAPVIEGIIPTFLQHFQLRTLINGKPFTGDNETHHVWAFSPKFDLSELNLAEITLLFSDVNLPPQLTLLSIPCTASTASWMMTLEQRETTYPNDEWFYVLMGLDTAGQGYGSHSTAIFDSNGNLLSTNRQLTTSFERVPKNANLKHLVHRLTFQAGYGLFRAAFSLKSFIQRLKR